MKILLIGYKNHALRLLKLLHEKNFIEKIFVYHPEPQKPKLSGIEKISPKIEVVDQFLSHDFNTAFIASPTDTHAGYLTQLAQKTSYIFCEKPPVNSFSELEALQKFDTKKKERIYFNFNYRWTEFALNAKEKITSGELGRPLRLDFCSTTGIGFKDSFRSDRRALDAHGLSEIAGNVGIHYVDLCQWLLGAPKNLAINKTRRLEFAAADTAAIEMRFSGGITASAFLSYAAPFKNSAELTFDNGRLELNNGQLTLSSPRDTFDNAGRFSSPPQKRLFSAPSSLEYFNASLEKSLNYFFSIVEKQQNFPLQDFKLSLDSTELILRHSA